jgi:hypothetical protein
VVETKSLLIFAVNFPPLYDGPVSRTHEMAALARDSRANSWVAIVGYTAWTTMYMQVPRDHGFRQIEMNQ